MFLITYTFINYTLSFHQPKGQVRVFYKTRLYKRQVPYHHGFWQRKKSRHCPPPPPPAPSAGAGLLSSARAQQPPVVAVAGPPGAFMVELLIFNGYPFKDHWAYWVRSHVDPDIGVMIHATGSVSSGFTFETRRNYNFKLTKNVPTKRIPLQWVNGAFFDERAMLNNGSYKTDTVPVCRFEASAYKVQCPVKSLNTTGQMVSSWLPLYTLFSLGVYRRCTAFYLIICFPRR